MLYLEPIAQLVEHPTFNRGVSQVRTLLGSLVQVGCATNTASAKLPYLTYGDEVAPRC